MSEDVEKMYDPSYASLVWKVVIPVLAFFRVVEVVPKSRILGRRGAVQNVYLF